MKQIGPVQLHAQTFTAEREWAVEEVPVLSAALSLPRPAVASDKVSRRIRRFYQMQARAYLRYCERWLLPLAAAEYREALENSIPLPHLWAELSYQVTYSGSGLWSLYTQSRESGLPGQQVILTRHADTWDLMSGYPVPLSAFFPSRRLWRRSCWPGPPEKSSARSAPALPVTGRAGGGRSAASSIPGTSISRRRVWSGFTPWVPSRPWRQAFRPFCCPSGKRGLRPVREEKTPG